jgi:hypothetical protein
MRPPAPTKSTIIAATINKIPEMMKASRKVRLAAGASRIRTLGPGTDRRSLPADLP